MKNLKFYLFPSIRGGALARVLAGVCILSFAFCLSTTIKAQRIELKSGNLDFLKGQKDINVEYVYDDMTVGKLKEEDYVNKKVADYNEKEAGKGDKWAVKWEEDRETRFQLKFEQLLNKYLEKSGVIVEQNNNETSYTLILKTTFTEPGFNIGIMRKPAFIDVEVVFVETENHDNILATIEIKKSPGADAMGYDFDTGTRIQEAYAKCGKELAKYLAKKAFK